MGQLREINLFQRKFSGKERSQNYLLFFPTNSSILISFFFSTSFSTLVLIGSWLFVAFFQSTRVITFLANMALSLAVVLPYFFTRFKHLLQILTRVTLPSTKTRLVIILGSNVRFVTRCEWETL